MNALAKTQIGMTGLLYIRVSSDEQIKGTSLDEQLEACRKYCDDNNIQVLGVFREEGASAKSTEREQFLEAIEFCRKHHVDAFVVWKTDRFARNLQDHYAVKSTLVKYGTKLHSVTEKFTDDPTGKLLEGMMAVIAEFDNDIRRQRCSGGMLGRIKKGVWPWHPPIGYFCPQNKKHDRKKESADPIDPVNFPILQRTLREFGKKPYTLTQFADALNQRGLVTTKGGKVDNRLADRVLTYHLRFYAGILDNPFYPNSGEKSYKGAHEPMITEDEMAAIQKMRLHKTNKDTAMKLDTYNELFPLKGTLFCQECAHKLTGGSTRGNGGIYHYYNCFTHGCSRKGKTLAKEKIEAEFLALISHITPTKEFLELFRTRVIDVWNEKGRKLDTDILKYHGELQTIKLDRVSVKVAQRRVELTEEQYIDSMASLDNKEMVKKISIHESRIEKYDIETTVIYATTFISNLSRTWFDLPRELRPQFQNLVFPEGVYVGADKKLRTTEVGFIYNLITKNTRTKRVFSDQVDPWRFELQTPSLQMRCSTS